MVGPVCATHDALFCLADSRQLPDQTQADIYHAFAMLNSVIVGEIPGYRDDVRWFFGQCYVVCIPITYLSDIHSPITVGCEKVRNWLGILTRDFDAQLDPALMVVAVHFAMSLGANSIPGISAKVGVALGRLTDSLAREC